MHEAALKHCFRTVAQHLNQTFGELWLWIGSGGLVKWPA
jgi:hypothetical protein